MWKETGSTGMQPVSAKTRSRRNKKRHGTPGKTGVFCYWGASVLELSEMD